MIQLYFGLPRCGKTTVATALALSASRRGRKVYVNFPLQMEGVRVIPNSWIGRYDMSDGLIIIDEASIYADSRKFGTFSDDLVSFFCMHGHWSNDIVLFTQIYNRVDSTIRMMAERVYYVRKNPILRFLTTVYTVPYGVAFTNTQEGKKGAYGDINEGYKRPNFWQRLFARRYFRPKYYKYFDTHYKPYELPPLPEQNE